jgi:hypothetical protein
MASWDNSPSPPHHRHDLATVELGHFLTLFGLALPEVSSVVSPFPSVFRCVVFHYPRNLLRGFLFTCFYNFYSPEFCPKLGLYLFCTNYKQMHN